MPELRKGEIRPLRKANTPQNAKERAAGLARSFFESFRRQTGYCPSVSMMASTISSTGARTPLATSPQASLPTPDDLHATLFENAQIRLRGGIFVHVGIHRRTHQHRTRRRKKRRRHHVIGNAVSHFRHDVRRGGSDAEQIGLLRQGDVLDGGIIGIIEGVGEHHMLGHARMSGA